MGVDLLDVSFRLEKSIGTRISMDDWTDLFEEHRDCTVGQLFDCIQHKMGVVDQLRYNLGLGVELNGVFWDRVRAGIVNTQALSPVDVQLSTSMDAVFARASRRSDWRRLQESLELDLQKLRYPVWFWRVRIVASLIWFTTLLCLANISSPSIWPFAAASFLMLILATSFGHLKSEFPSRIRTVKDLLRSLRDLNLETFAAGNPTLINQLTAWRLLKESLVDALGVDDDEVVRDAWLVKDLGCA